MLGLSGNLMGSLMRAATSIRPDKEAKDKEKNKPGYTKKATIDIGGLQLAETEANKKLAAKM